MINEMPERTFRSSPPGAKQVTFDLDQRPQPFPPYPTTPPIGAAMPLRGPSLRQTPILYEPRRTPLPPSMRRNRSPPQRHFDDMGVVPGSDSTPNLPSQTLPRSNTISSQMPTQPPVPVMFSNEMMRRVRRSASLNTMDSRYPNIPAEPVHIHPAIPEVPSGQSSPMREKPIMSIEAHTQPFMRPDSFLKTPTSERWSVEPPRQLVVRNPSSPTDSEVSNIKQLGEIVRRVSNIRQGEHKVQDAAKNF